MSGRVTPVVRAAGAVPWRVRHGRLEVALVHRPRYQDWSWPKGKVDPGESDPAGAVREVAEEIGEQVVLGVPLPTLGYRTPDGGGKLVHYWAARIATEADAPALRARPDTPRASLDEIDDVVWVSARTAAQLLTRRSDRPVLDAVNALWKRNRLATRVLVVARHGQARRRKSWADGEATRPLTGKGTRQATALVPVLSAFGVGSVTTSPWHRCLHTITPYGEGTGIEIECVDALTEAAHKADPAAATAAVTRYLRRPEDTVVVTHRPVLGAVTATIEGATRSWTTGRVPGKDPYLRTGELLVVHVAGKKKNARVVALERHRPTPTG